MSALANHLWQSTLFALALTTIFTHIWQSTLFAAVAALVAFALRKNRAQVRYCVWLSASLKFAVPFSMFITLGSHIPWQPSARPQVSSAMLQIARPLQAIPVFFPALQQTTPAPGPVPMLMLAIWLIGFLLVLLRWARSWLRVRSAVLSAVPLSWETPIPAVETSALMEPGVFGIFRPVLVLPKGITRKLKTEHLQAILAHELCHVRRRDNLAAAAHMLMEALFWFHPLVWWIGARIVAERERACDEDVLRLGNQPEVYAESILKVCQFYLESPLVCVAGVTGADLKHRVARIMAQQISGRLSVKQKLLVGVVTVTAVAFPLTVGLLEDAQPPVRTAFEVASVRRMPPAGSAQTPTPSFEVASIKPTKPGSEGVMLRIKPGAQFTATNVTLKMLMEEAYDVKDSQISATPPWFDSEHYDVDAKPDEAVGAALDKLPPDQRHDQMMRMIQGLLEDRFKLTLDHQSKDLPIYALTLAKGGSKLKPSAFKPSDKPQNFAPPGPSGAPPPGGIWINGPGKVTSTGIQMKVFATVLSRVGDLGRVVVDKTGLEGPYDFSLQWTPDNAGPNQSAAAEAMPEGANASLFTAIQEQLGLKLEAQKAPMPYLVIKHVEKPSDN
jgi:uncharacterized protein (TIGR03435 family)